MINLSYHPLCFCESCKQIKRRDWMKTEIICIGCYEGGQSEDTDQTAMGGASSAPGQAKEEKTRLRRQAGQLTLEI